MTMNKFMADVDDLIFDGQEPVSYTHLRAHETL